MKTVLPGVILQHLPLPQMDILIASDMPMKTMLRGVMKQLLLLLEMGILIASYMLM
jgi:hypothetical protein